MISLVIAICEFILCAGMFHRAMPAVMVEGKLHALKIWALGLALGIFAVARFMDFMGDVEQPWVYAVGHFFLILYAWRRLTFIRKNYAVRDWTMVG